jgi:hypothetical protein
MPTYPPPQRSSPASPGQSVRRERLAQLYDEMGDTVKQELLQFAEDLSGQATPAEGIGMHVAPIRPEPASWESDQLRFELQQSNRRISCSVSRQVLEQAGPGRGARRWQLMEAFERLRPRFEQIARNKLIATPWATDVIEIFAVDLTATLDEDPEPAAPAAALHGG